VTKCVVCYQKILNAKSAATLLSTNGCYCIIQLPTLISIPLQNKKHGPLTTERVSTGTLIVPVTLWRSIKKNPKRFWVYQVYISNFCITQVLLCGKMQTILITFGQMKDVLMIVFSFIHKDYLRFYFKSQLQGQKMLLDLLVYSDLYEVLRTNIQFSSPYRFFLLETAACFNHLSAMEWALNSGCGDVSLAFSVGNLAAANGSLEWLQWAHKNGVNLSVATC
jgi:hypothetical protein